MSKSTTTALLLLLAGLVPGDRAQAQDPMEENAVKIQRLEEALDRLIEHRDEARIRAETADSLRALERGLTIDSTRIGPFWVLTRPAHTETLTEDFAAAWSHYSIHLEGASEGLLRELGTISFGLQYGDGFRDRIASKARVAFERYHTASERRRRIGRVISQHLTHRLPGNLDEWTPGLGLYASDATRDAWTYRDLLVTRSKVARGCFEGSLDDCWRAVGLLDRENWWESWYEPHELQPQVMKRYSTPWRDVADRHPGHFSDCVYEANSESCLAYIRGPGGQEFRGNGPAPLKASANESLVAHALRLGGTGSYLKLRAYSDAPLREHLAEVAGVSEDELIRSWRAQVMAARPDPTEGTTGTAAATLGWIALLLAFATRSTRWRI